MSKKVFKWSVALVGILFTLIFCILILPPFIKNPDIVSAFANGFVNPYASGYSTDVICCWLILILWVGYEYPKVKYGWICVILGLVPGVAVGFAFYLIIRDSQLEPDRNTQINLQ